MPWIDLTDVKLHLNKDVTVTTEDAELSGFIAAACSAIEERMGHVDNVTVVEVCTAGSRGLVVLEQRPVRSVDVILEQASGRDITDGCQQLGAGGVLQVPSCSPLEVTYQAGRFPVPGNFRMAALEMVTHLWKASQLYGGLARDRSSRFGDANQLIVPGLANALPYRVRELLGLDGKQLSDSVLLA